MDFVFGFPRTPRQNDSISVIVGRLTKSAHFTLFKSTYSAEDYKRIDNNEIEILHRIPLSIISDRGSQLTSHF